MSGIKKMLAHVSWTWKVLGLSAILLSVSIAIAAGGGVFVNKQVNGLQVIVEAAQQRGDRAASVSDAIVDVDRALQKLIAATEREETRSAAIAAIGATSTLDERVHELGEAFGEQAQVVDLRELLESLRPAQLKVIKAARKDDDAAALEYSQALLNDTTRAKTIANALVANERQALTGGLNSFASEFRHGTKLVAILVLCALLGGLGLSIYAARLISAPLRQSIADAERIGSGDLSVPIKVEGSDEFAQLQMAFSSMQTNLKQGLDNERKIARSNTRIRQALDNARANVMMINHDNEVLYINKLMWRTFDELSVYEVDSIVGNSLEEIAANRTHLEALRSVIGAKRSVTVECDQRTFELFANSVISEEDEVLGTVIEWKERTYERAVEREVEQIVVAAKQGDLSERICLDDKQGFFKNLAVGINELLDVASGSLGDIAKVMSALSDGKLTARIDREYDGMFGDVREDVNETSQKLRQIVQQIRDVSMQMRETCEEVASSNKQVAERTNEQASGLARSAGAMNEITDIVRDNATQAQAADALAAQARGQAENGGDVVQNAIGAMEEINQASEKIAAIIHIIDEIAFQTNLLALNAAVEAARAGEDGRGFAVVASEVRHLAQRSATAANEIKELIADTVQKVDDGSRLVSDSGAALSRIVETTTQVSEIISAISRAGEAQAISMKEMSVEIESMDNSARESAEIVGDSARITQAMSGAALNLHELVDYFDVGHLGSDSKGRAGSAPEIAEPALLLLNNG